MTPSPHRQPDPSQQLASALIARLALPRDLRQLPLMTIHIVKAVRLCALIEAVGQDPLEGMARRLRSMEAARAMLSLAQLVGTAWPEAFRINRPCCMSLSPDETALADMVWAATQRDSQLFAAAVKDMISDAWHDVLFRACALTIATLQPLIAPRPAPGSH